MQHLQDYFLSKEGPDASEIQSGKREQIAVALRPQPRAYHQYLSSLTDTHNHMCGFSEKEHAAFNQRRKVLLTLPAAGRHMIVSVTPNDWKTFVCFCNDNDEHQRCLYGFGIHPMHASHAQESFPSWLDELRSCLEASPASFVGEIGLDNSKRYKPFQQHQISIFIDQLKIAAEFRRPCSIHSVKSSASLVNILSAMEALPPTISLHSFCGSLETLERIQSICTNKQCKVFVGLNPTTNLCKKNLACYLQGVRFDRMLVETDFSCSDYPYNGSSDLDIGKLLLHAVGIISLTTGEEYHVVVEHLMNNTKEYLSPLPLN